MKYIPKMPRADVNVPANSLLGEFLRVSAKLFAAFIVIYLFLGFAVNWAVPYVSPEMESKLGVLFQGYLKNKATFPEYDARVTEVLNKIVAAEDKERFHLKIRVVDEADLNAIAFPGGTVVVYKGLVDGARSENELAMVLGHEIGHYRNHDHLRGVGRGLSLMMLSMILSGGDSVATEWIGRSLVTTDRSFSRAQELAADEVGIELLNRAYGHIGGATDFFLKVDEKYHQPWYQKFYSTHPLPTDRINRINELRNLKGYVLKETIPFKI